MILVNGIYFFSIVGLILGLASVALTEAERESPRGGGAYPASPLGLLVTRLMGWTALILVLVLSLWGFGIVYPGIIAAAIALAMFKIGGAGIPLTRYYGLRLPISVAALVFAIALWLAFLSLLQGVPT